MTTEQKAEAYDVAIEKVRALYNHLNNEGTVIYPFELENIFSELKESEDERIRKELIAEVKDQIDRIPSPDCMDEEDEKALKQLKKWLAWLEKQGGQKSMQNPVEGKYPYTNPASTLDGEIDNIWNKLQCEGKFTATKDGFSEVIHHFANFISQQKPADGTFVNVDEVRDDFMAEVYRVLDADPTNDRANQIIDAFDSLPTTSIQKPADKVEPKFKPGDIIQYKGMGHKRHTIKEVCGITLTHYINSDGKRMDISYTDANFELVEQKPTEWSEEDEEMVKTAIECIEAGNPLPTSVYSDCIRWLKSLKDRVQPKIKWNEEDQRQWNNIFDVLDGRFELSEIGYKHAADWFLKRYKYFRPQNHWKPSDEQVNALLWVIENVNKPENIHIGLNSLYEQLKKL